MSPPLGNSEIWDPIKSTAEKFPLRQCGNGRATWIARICFGFAKHCSCRTVAMRRGLNILLCMSGKMPRRYDVGANSFGPSIAIDRFVKPFQFAQRFFGIGFVQFRAPVQQIPCRAK